jgi:hypothetical protein
MIKIESNFFKKQANVHPSIVHFEKEEDGWHYVDEMYLSSEERAQDEINKFIQRSVEQPSLIESAGPNVFVVSNSMFKVKNSNQKFSVLNGKVEVHV